MNLKDIRARNRLESILIILDLPLIHGDDIEAYIQTGDLMFVDIQPGGLPQFLLFAFVDPGCGMPVIPCQGMLYLDKDKTVLMSADDIDFIAGHPQIAMEDLVSEFLQIFDSSFFARSPSYLAGTAHRAKDISI